MEGCKRIAWIKDLENMEEDNILKEVDAIACSSEKLINEVIKFNSEEVPPKMGTFSQYEYPHTKARYAEVADYLGLGGKTDEGINL